MTAGVAERIFLSANFSRIKILTESCVGCSEDENGQNKREEEAQVSQ